MLVSMTCALENEEKFYFRFLSHIKRYSKSFSSLLSRLNDEVDTTMKVHLLVDMNICRGIIAS